MVLLCQNMTLCSMKYIVIWKHYTQTILMKENFLQLMNSMIQF